MSELLHRFFLVPIRTDVDATWAHEHWTGHHAALFGANPGLRGYVQNRPPRDAWPGRTHICAEAWFDDHAAEHAAFRSRFYLDEVVADENRFVRRDEAWHATVDVARRAAQTRTHRVLVFGHDRASAAELLARWADDGIDHDIDEYSVDRAVPLGGRASILALWVDDLTSASAAATHFGPLAWVSRPVAVVRPPHPPWNGEPP